MCNGKLILTTAFILTGLSPLQAMSNPTCAATLATKGELAVTKPATGLLIEGEAVALDQYGNRLVVPNPYAKTSLAKRVWGAITRKKAPIVEVQPQKAPLDFQYFLKSFRPELEAKLNKKEIQAQMLTELDKRLLTAKNRDTGDEFYLLRLDENPDEPLANLFPGGNTPTSLILILSFEPHKLHRPQVGHSSEAIRVQPLGHLIGATSVDEVIRRGIPTETNGNYRIAHVREIYEISNGDRFIVGSRLLWERKGIKPRNVNHYSESFDYVEKSSEAPAIETFDEVLAKYAREAKD